MSASSSSAVAVARTFSFKLLAVLALGLSLSACDYVSRFGKPKMTPEEVKAEGIALGAGCRQAGQTLEDCYQRNPDSQKAGIFAGWKDMHEYMAAKNIPTVTPPPEKTEAELAKDKEVSPVREDRASRRERERAASEKNKDSSSDRGSDGSYDRSSRRNRDRDDSSGRNQG